MIPQNLKDKDQKKKISLAQRIQYRLVHLLSKNHSVKMVVVRKLDVKGKEGVKTIVPRKLDAKVKKSRHSLCPQDRTNKQKVWITSGGLGFLAFIL